MQKPKHYLNNKELLKEIHLSKITYCAFKNFAADHKPDAYLTSIDDINDEVIETARAVRAKRLLELENVIVPPSSIPTTDLVFRVATWDHIPLAPPKPPKNPPKKESLIKLFDFDEDLIDEPVGDEPALSKKHVRINFPPFFHYRLDEYDSPYIVGKSHWQGDLESGEFCCTHGKVSDRLARMFLVLSERYATKGNWRNYSYVDEMRGAAIIALVNGALKFDESKGSNPFSFYTTCLKNAFTGILLYERNTQNIRDDILEMNGMTPSFTRQFANSYNWAEKHGPVETITAEEYEQSIQKSTSVHGHSLGTEEQLTSTQY